MPAVPAHACIGWAGAAEIVIAPTVSRTRRSSGWRSETAALLPVPYFLVTFTVPQALRKIVRANQRVGYRAIFDAGSETIRRAGVGIAVYRHRPVGLLRSTAHLGARLHGLSSARALRGSWRRVSARTDLVGWPARKTSCCPRKQRRRSTGPSFAIAMREAGLLRKSTPSRPTSGRNTGSVDVEPVGDGRATLKYLAPYVYRVAISNNRIVAVDDIERPVSFHPLEDEELVVTTVRATNSCAASCSTRCRATFSGCVTTASPAQTASCRSTGFVCWSGSISDGFLMAKRPASEKVDRQCVAGNAAARCSWWRSPMAAATCSTTTRSRISIRDDTTTLQQQVSQPLNWREKNGRPV